MKRTRFAVKAVAAGVATTVLLLGTLAAPASAKKGDTGWNGVGGNGGVSHTMRDTGWNGV